MKRVRRPNKSNKVARRRARKPDAQPFDTVHISIQPFFKENDVTGSEWRIKVVTEISRNGQIHHRKQYSSMEEAVHSLSYEWIRARHNNGRMTSEETVCDQEGCGERATVLYKMKQDYCHAGHASDPYEKDALPLARQFCAIHATRGTQDFSDRDDNYIVIAGKKKPSK